MSTTVTEPNELESVGGAELEPESPVTLAEVVAQLDNGGEIDIVTALVVTAILDEYQDLAAQWLRSPVRDYVRRARRAAARRAEDDAFAAAAQPVQHPSPPAKSAQPPVRQPAAAEQARPEDQAAEPEPVTSFAPDPLAAYRELRSSTFWVPGYGPVSWGEATETDHKARASWLRDHAGTLVTDAERHEQAARLIHDAGVERLADIDGF